ncbi:MAG: oxidoreductase fad/nad(p)-binding domain protein [Microgenomates group bacterium GW2011_GWA2_44_7]|nr:MAG: oxidoreductase fad/nad(p)-binding domain protein [Microgenomates group bacterium GW2011_GWA2_44_7]KKT78396.1 MAG: oxidoreductase fad/nad(p)-binding domain protein [Microgenomates group bacterium GW2011_GWB1_44_8]
MPKTQPQKAKVAQIRFLTESTYILKLERNGFQFIPGQCINVGLPGLGVNREYSTYSGIKDPYLEFLIKRIDGGLVSTKLSLLDPGDEVTLDGAYGLFTIKKPSDKKCRYLFIASGTGIAPFHSFLRSYPKLNCKILHGIRFVREQYEKDHYPKEVYTSCVSGERGGDFRGRVTGYLKKHSVTKDTTCYVCGNSSMINDVYDILRNQGLSASNILTETFF